MMTDHGAHGMIRPANAHRSECGSFAFILRDDADDLHAIRLSGSTYLDSLEEAESITGASELVDWQEQP